MIKLKLVKYFNNLNMNTTPNFTNLIFKTLYPREFELFNNFLTSDPKING